MDEEADVDDVMPDDMRIVLRGGLDELDDVALRIFDAEGFAAVAVVGDICGRLPAFDLEIEAHAFGIVGLETGVVQAIDAGVRRQRQDFDKLCGVESVTYAFRVLRVSLACRADDMRVVALGRLRIGGVDGKVRDAGDLRAGMALSLCRHCSQRYRAR